MRRIGIDVGGTNTDAAVVEVSGTAGSTGQSAAGGASRVLAGVKSPTTEDVLSGINAALAGVSNEDVDAVIIGTTHFTNAVVQRRHLNRVGFLRLCLPTGRTLPPLVGWPSDLAEAIRGETVMVAGGVEFDGRPFELLDEAAVVEACRRFADAGLRSIVVAGSFSPVDSSQEERAAELVSEHLPGASVTMSHKLGRLGLLERENAAGLNACLIELAQTTIAAFADALGNAGFAATTKLFLTQNDGTILDLDEARRYPVLTFASGPTNSMRGAALLGGVANGLVVDVGGTTADFGALSAGYPRQANAAVDVGGVRTLFQLPDVLSIGVGGGSRVTEIDGRPCLGPESVGQRLLTDALSFGGDVLTLTDAAISTGRLSIDGVEAPVVANGREILDLAGQMIAENADRMKLSGDAVPLVAVGGGAFAVPDELPGVSEVIRPQHAGTANAVGAALAEVSGQVDHVFTDLGRDAALAAAVELAGERAVASGAKRETLTTIELEDLPLAYLPGDARRVRARVVGQLG